MTPIDSAVPVTSAPAAAVAPSEAAPIAAPTAAPEAASEATQEARSGGVQTASAADAQSLQPRQPRRPGGGDRRGARGGRGPRGATGGNEDRRATAGDNAGPRGPARGPQPGGARQHPVLDQLASLYPQLFGDTLLPLKRGIYQDLLAAQPEALDKDGLKAALALHTRSSRYLTVVAAGLKRHDLAGQPVEDLTPEQVHHALIEVFRRRGSRSREDLRPKLRQRILQAFEASGLSREDYALRVMGRDEEVNQLTQDALAEAASRAARDAALLRTFEASGHTVEAFADMYGLHPQDAQRTLDRARERVLATAAAAAAADAADAALSAPAEANEASETGEAASTTADATTDAPTADAEKA